MPQRNQFVQTDFSKGELSEKMDGRIDTDIYRQGVSVLRNFITMRQGGISKIPGTKHVRVAIDSDHMSVLHTAYIKPGAAYILEFGNQSMSVFKDGVRVHSGVITPWLSVDLRKLQFVQVRDVFYVACEGYKLQTITWVDDDDWTVADAVFKDTSVDFTSDADHYPRGVAYHEARLILFGTPEKPTTVWGSTIPMTDGGELDFILGTNDADAWEFRIASGENEDLLWAVSKGVLVLGARTGEHILTGHGEGITPSNVYTEKQTSFGCYELPGVLVNDVTLFVQAGGRLMREYFFVNEQQAYQSPELTFFSDHIFSGGAVQIAIQRNPELIVWVVTGDGDLAGVTYDRTMQVVGFHRHETSGQIESIATIQDGEEDLLMVAVRRYINENWVRHIEVFDKRRVADQALSVFVHDGVTTSMGEVREIEGITNADPAVVTSTGHGFSNGDIVRIDDVEGMVEANAQQYVVANAGANTFQLRDETDQVDVDSTEWGEYDSGGTLTPVTAEITSLAYLEGQEVAVLVNGGAHANKTVFNGAIQLDGYFNKVVVGIPYTAKCRLMRIGGSELKRIHKLYIRFLNTVGCKVGPEETRLQELIWHQIGSDLTVPPELFSGDKEESFPGKYDRDGYVWLYQDTPTPITVLSVTADMAQYQGA